MKIVSLTEKQFDKFARNNYYKNYYQSSYYGKLREKYDFNANYIGFVDESDTLVAASLILYKEVMMGYKYAYAPRGFLIDYNDTNLLKDFVQQLKDLLYKQKFIFLKIDPQIYISERDSEGNIIAYNPKANDTIKVLEDIGFKYSGANKFFETAKPRWEAIVKLNIPINEQYKYLNKNTRNKINKAIKSGIEIYRKQDGATEEIYKFIKSKHDKGSAFYKDFYEIFNEEGMFEIYCAKLNTEKFVINSKNAYEQELESNETLANKIQNPNGAEKDIRKILNKKMESDKLLNIYKNNLVKATSLLKQFPNGFLVGGAYVIKYENTTYLLIDGFDKKYSDLNPLYLLRWVLIQNATEEEYEIVNLNGVVGEFKEKNKYSGLNEMKLGYNSTIAEYIGEFDLTINNFMYNMYSNIKPINSNVKDKIN